MTTGRPQGFLFLDLIADIFIIRPGGKSHRTGSLLHWGLHCLFGTTGLDRFRLRGKLVKFVKIEHVVHENMVDGSIMLEGAFKSSQVARNESRNVSR